MANVPSYNERMDTIRMVEEICKTKGEYATKRFISFDQMMTNILNRSKGLKSSLVNCIASIKNFISEYIKLAQIELEVKTKLSLNWFKGFLNLILKAAKNGIKLATSFVEKIMKRPITENDKGKKSAWGSIKSDAKTIYNFVPVKAVRDFVSKSANKVTKSDDFSWAEVTANIVKAMIFGIVTSVVSLGISWWLKHVVKTDNKLRTKQIIFKKVRGKWNNWFGNDEDDMADLEPPDPEVPNVTMTYVNEIQQSMFDLNFRTIPRVGSMIDSAKQKYFSSMMSDKEYDDADPDGNIPMMPDPSTPSNRDNLETPWVNQQNSSVQKQPSQDPEFYTDANGNPIQHQPSQMPMNRYGIPNLDDMPEIGMGLEQFDNPNLKESPMIVGAGLLFILFLKAAIASSYNEEIASQTMVLKSAVPNSFALGLTTDALALGAGAAAFSK